jgi:hypothetical protein
MMLLDLRTSPNTLKKPKSELRRRGLVRQMNLAKKVKVPNLEWKMPLVPPTQLIGLKSNLQIG